MVTLIKRVLRWYWKAVTEPLNEDEEINRQTYSL